MEVDVELFEEVEKRIGGHPRKQEERKRRHRSLFPLTVACAHCGCEYNGNRLKELQGGSRGYAHAKPKARMDEAGHQRFVAAGCKVWYVDAEQRGVRGESAAAHRGARRLPQVGR